MICALFPSLSALEGDFLQCRLVVDEELDENSLNLLDVPDLLFSKCVKRAYFVAKLYIDGGNPETLRKDRKIEDIKETRFMRVKSHDADTMINFRYSSARSSASISVLPSRRMPSIAKRA